MVMVDKGRRKSKQEETVKRGRKKQNNGVAEM
jgi:hypothetical protein